MSSNMPRFRHGETWNGKGDAGMKARATNSTGRVRPAVLQRLKADIAGEIVEFMNRKKLSAQAAQKHTGIDAGLFLAVRRGELDRFSPWSLGMLLNHLNPPEWFTPPLWVRHGPPRMRPRGPGRS